MLVDDLQYWIISVIRITHKSWQLLLEVGTHSWCCEVYHRNKNQEQNYHNPDSSSVVHSFHLLSLAVPKRHLQCLVTLQVPIRRVRKELPVAGAGRWIAHRARGRRKAGSPAT